VVKSQYRRYRILFRYKKQVDWIKGKGRIAAAGQVVVEGKDGSQNLRHQKKHYDRHRSESMPLPASPVDEKRIVHINRRVRTDIRAESMSFSAGGVIGL